MNTQRTAFNDNAAGSGLASDSGSSANDNGAAAEPATVPTSAPAADTPVWSAAPARSPARRAAVLAARAASDGTPPLGLAIYVAVAVLAIGAFVFAGCGPELPPASLIDSTRVVGARVEVDGEPARASPTPGEKATITWLVTAPATPPTLGWAFALCLPGAPGRLDCPSAPLALYEGASNPPRVTVQVPSYDDLAGVPKLTLYGRICTDAAPTFDPVGGFPGCADGAEGTTATVSIALQDVGAGGADANFNPATDRGFTFDGADWPGAVAGVGDDPCTTGPHVAAGSGEHTIATVLAGADRERYTRLGGDPPAPTAVRESLQLSYFSTAGALDVPFGFVEAADPAEESAVAVTWTAPKAGTQTADTPVSFTFVTRGNRGGTTWTTRAACVTP